MCYKTPADAGKELKQLEGEDFNAVINSPLKSKQDLIRLIQIVYAWMPTMITPFYKVSDFDNINFERLLWLAKSVRKRKVSEKEEEDILMQLSKLTKNRLVGTSKIMMILNPEVYPIYDSRVISTWNNIFKASQIKDESMKLKPEKAI